MILQLCYSTDLFVIDPRGITKYMDDSLRASGEARCKNRKTVTSDFRQTVECLARAYAHMRMYSYRELQTCNARSSDLKYAARTGQKSKNNRNFTMQSYVNLCGCRKGATRSRNPRD